jgi:hypothetical protein
VTGPRPEEETAYAAEIAETAERNSKSGNDYSFESAEPAETAERSDSNGQKAKSSKLKAKTKRNGNSSIHRFRPSAVSSGPNGRF